MRMSESELKNNAILYSYPGGELDIICFSDRGIIGPGWEADEAETAKRAKREKGKKSEGEDRLRSMRRARANLRRLALANDFQYFVTLTLDGDKIDRYDGAAIVKRLNQWTSNMVQRHGLRYVLVPERHKDGAFHFHGFFTGDGLQLIDSGTITMAGWKHPRRPRSTAQRAKWLSEGGRVVYNLPQWTLGFSTALELYGTYSSAVGYVCKYIGKQDGERALGRWYYSGGALRQPDKEYVTLDYRELREDFKGECVELEIPGSSLLVIHTKQEEENGNHGS